MSSQYIKALEYSYDPTSPFICEYDSPYPLALGKPPLSNNDSLYFPVIDLDINKSCENILILDRSNSGTDKSFHPIVNDSIPGISSGNPKSNSSLKISMKDGEKDYDDDSNANIMPMEMADNEDRIASPKFERENENEENKREDIFTLSSCNETKFEKLSPNQNDGENQERFLKTNNENEGKQIKDILKCNEKEYGECVINLPTNNINCLISNSEVPSLCKDERLSPVSTSLEASEAICTNTTSFLIKEQAQYISPEVPSLFKDERPSPVSTSFEASEAICTNTTSFLSKEEAQYISPEVPNLFKDERPSPVSTSFEASEAICTNTTSFLSKEEAKYISPEVRSLFKDERPSPVSTSFEASEAICTNTTSFLSKEEAKYISSEVPSLFKDERPSSVSSFEASEAICTNTTSFSSKEEAQYISPGSSSQSISSLLTDTITINVPFDYSLSSGNECNENKSKNDSGLTTDRNLNNTHSNTLSMVSEYEDDCVLESFSPAASPPLTDSCTITPFPTDIPTPYSTNPTSSPLPTDLVSNTHSESSPSTPSTVTSTTMHSVFKKLENLSSSVKANNLTNNNDSNSTDNHNNVKVNDLNSGMPNVSSSNNLVVDNFVDGNKETMVLNTNKALKIMDNSDLCLNIGYKKTGESSTVSKLRKNLTSDKENIGLNENIKNSCGKHFMKSEVNSRAKNIFKANGENRTMKMEKTENLSLPFGIPPPPPPRSSSSLKHFLPPLPPPPVEESEEEPVPPVPSLPLNIIKEDIEIGLSSPPNPPTRQYLLIPLTPGISTPLLLTPPPLTSHRCCSYRKSPPPSPPPPLPPPPSSSQPPLPPKPKAYNLTISTNKNQRDNSIVLEKIDEYKTLQNNRLFPILRELTPVPEESSSPTRASPSPSENMTEDENICKLTEMEKSYIVNGKKETKHRKKDLNSNLKPKHFSTSASPPPPPLPPKPSKLQLSPVFKTPPPPPIRTGSIPGTPNSDKSSNRLSPCRIKDRSPPNDRVLNYSPSDSEAKIESSSEPVASQDSPCKPPPPPIPADPLSHKSSCTSVSKYGKLIINRSDLPLPTPEEEIRKVYANATKWGWLDDRFETLVIYTQFRPVIQQGPMCGLVALEMASQVCPSSVSAEKLLVKAKEKGISRQGEMFSVEAMSNLANDLLKGVKATAQRDLLPSSVEIIRILLDGDFILFPYDAEPNHVPGFKKGRKAHWGLLCGCLIQNKDLRFRPETTPFKADPTTDYLWHLRPVPPKFKAERCSSAPPTKVFPNQEIRVSRSVSPYQVSSGNCNIDVARRLGYLPTQEGCEDKNFNVIGLYRQGKSRNLTYAPFIDICRSNEQLCEYLETEEYVIDSVEEGLSKQVVVLHKEAPSLADLLGTLQEEQN